MKPWCACASVCLAGVVAASSASAGVSLYKQEVFAGNGFSSTLDPTAIFAFRAADNFTLGSASTIDQVRWWGNGDDFDLPDLQNFTQFDVALFSRLPSGLPGSLLYEESFATSDTNPVDTGLLSFNNSRVFQQTATLATPQSLAPGEYMLSVAVSGYVDNQGSIWFWNTSSQGDGFVAYDSYDGAGWQPFTQAPIDVAFELIGVPTPGALGLFAVAGVGMGARRRRAV